MVVNVSSSTVRWLLGYGRVADAATCLGRPYELSGLVVQGFQRGRAIGVPTANLEVIDQLVPADGVYAGQCVIDGQIYLAAVNIGTSPSFDKQRFQIEAHLLDFSGDLYGRSLDLQLLQWVRDTTRFPSIDSLKAQISLDIESVRVAIPDSAGRTSKV
jgi:riboflavin kinase/FMN adenylyltransferase